MTTYLERLKTACEFIKSKISSDIDLLIVAGSGFKDALPDLGESKTIPMKDVPGFPLPKVQGHGADFKFGTYTGKKVLIATGRIHFYEGHPLEDVVFMIRMASFLNCKGILLTNAAGSVDHMYRPGDLVLIKDQINLTGQNCEIGPSLGHTRFIDMSSAYDPTWSEKVNKKFKLATGVYAGLTGPTYETKAEAKMLSVLGANMVGMSTVQECIAARSHNMKVLGLSLITNMAGGLGGNVSHAEVLEMANSQIPQMKKLITTAIETF